MSQMIEQTNTEPKDAKGVDQRLVSQKRDAVLLKHLLEYHCTKAVYYTRRAHYSTNPDEDAFYSRKGADHTEWHSLLERAIPLLTNA